MIMFLLTPIVLPIAALAGLRQKAVRKAIAKETRCSHCEQRLGVRSVQIADKAWRKLNLALVKEDPDAHTVGVRTLYAVCPHCQALYTFHGKRKKFKLMRAPTSHNDS